MYKINIQANFQNSYFTHNFYLFLRELRVTFVRNQNITFGLINNNKAGGWEPLSYTLPFAM